MNKVFFSILLVATSIFVSSNLELVNAQQLQSPGYRIESGGLIIQPEPDRNSADYDGPASFGPDAQKKFEEKGYVIVGNRIANSSEKSFIRFRLDKSQLVFDGADARGESIQSNSLNVTGGGSTNVIVSLRQQEQFKNSFGATIEPTRCDNERSKCTPVLSQIWKKAFGFGYQATGGSARDFGNIDAYRPLFVGGSTEQAAVLFDGEIDKSGAQLDLRFKLRPQPETQTGIYMSTVIITASADY